MATRSVIVRLEAEVSKFVQGQEKARKATEETAKAQEELGKVVDQTSGKAERGGKRQSQASEDAAKSSKKSEEASKQDAAAKKKQADAADTAGKSLTAFGAVSVAALGASVKAAMDWESAWAGVTKTVDGTPEQMADLESELRGLAKTLPLSHTEIAAVAEAAGQLGVKRKDVASFTKTMIDLGETTNLTADEAATNIAQIANVMGTAGADVDNFGATLVALGNDGASTEKEILDMAQRIAGAGKLVGASEADVLALSNTLASVGIEAQLGGGVTSRVLQRMYADVKTGGKGLQELAKVSGMSSKQFAAAFESDPIRAMDMMVKGLSAVKDSGGNVVQTMEDLGIKGTEETSVILRLAGAGDLLSKSLELGSKAWEENLALANEAAKRYETTDSKVKVAWNNIKDAAIDAGAVVLPVVQGLAESVAGLAQTWESVPTPVQGALTILAGGIGVATLVGGAFLTLTPKIRDSVEAFRDLNTRADGSSRGLGRIGKAAGVATVAMVGLAAVGALVVANAGDATTTVEQFNNALTGLATKTDGAKALDANFQNVLKPDIWRGGTTEVNSLGNALQRVFNPSWQDNLSDFGLTAAGQNASTGVNITKKALSDLDRSIASLSQSGNTKDASAGFRQVAAEAKKQGKNVEDLIPLFPAYADAVRSAKTANGETQISQQDLAKAMMEGGGAAQEAASKQSLLDTAIHETGVSIEGVVEDMDKFLEQLFDLGKATMSARDANAAYQDQLDSVPGVLKQIADSGGKMGAILLANRTDFDLTTEAGRLANETFQGLAQKGMTEVEAMAKEGLGQDKLQEKLNTTYTDLVNMGIGFGMGKTEAEKLARAVLGVPAGVNIKTWMDDTARQEAEKTKAAVESIPSQKSVDVFFNNHHTEFFEVNDPKGVSLGKGQQFAGFAGGGDLDSAPGPKGVDSKLFYGAKGEHVLTASEVDLMGGQQAVYKFRSDLRSGRVTSHAAGGEVGVRYQMPAAALARYAPASAAAQSRSFTQEVTFHGAPAYTREQFEAFADQRLNQQNRRFQ